MYSNEKKSITPILLILFATIVTIAVVYQGVFSSSTNSKEILKQNIYDAEKTVLDIYTNNKSSKQTKEILQMAIETIQLNSSDKTHRYFILHEKFGYYTANGEKPQLLEFRLLSTKSELSSFIIRDIINENKSQEVIFHKANKNNQRRKRIAYTKYIKELDIVVGVSSAI